jgi:hypothetical protein
MRGISVSAAKLSASQEGTYSVELVCWLVGYPLSCVLCMVTSVFR